MNLDVIRSEAKRRLTGYKNDCEMVANWESYSDPQAKRGDNLGIRSGKTSDPTASVATNRASPPQYIVVAREWRGVINDAWADLLFEDEQKGYGDKGKAFVLERYYGLTSPKIANRAERVADIEKECAISESTVNVWLKDAVDRVVCHAISRRLE